MNFVYFSHLPYEINDQHYLLAAATRAGNKAAYVEWTRDCRIFVDDEVAATLPRWSSPRRVAETVYGLIGRERTILVDGMATKTSLASFLFPKPTKDSVRIYGVFDDYRYDKTGLRLLRFHIAEQLVRARNDYTWIFNADIQPRYPDAIFVDNASYLTPNPAVRDADPSRVVYVGSIDLRADLSLLDKIATANPDLQIDIHGAVKKGYVEFDKLVAAHPNIHYFGKWQERDFPAILARYRIGLIPYKADHRLTKYISSSKMYHYLNCGLEVITTPFPQVRTYKDYVHVLNSADDWAQVYREALTQPRAPNWPYEKFLWDARWRELCDAVERRERAAG
ncbi:MAG: hypothetical protein WDM81_19250 [Rhizomicrobium sp.]